MNKCNFIRSLIVTISIFSFSQIIYADHREITYRRSNFSNEFNIKTPEGINARGFAKVKSKNSHHQVSIHVNGLPPGETYVILNHWFEPISERGIPDSAGALIDPSCNGHFQSLGDPIISDRKGRLSVHVRVDQIAPHIWVANLAKFMEVTNGGTQAPASADAFVTGGLLMPFEDIVENEADFIDTDPLTNCGM